MTRSFYTQSELAPAARRIQGLRMFHALLQYIPIHPIDLGPSQGLEVGREPAQLSRGQTAHHHCVFGAVQGLGTAMEKRMLEPFLLLVVKRKSNQLHRPLATQFASFRAENEFDQLDEVALTEGLVMVAGEVEGFGGACAAERFEECPLDLLAGQRRADGEVVSHHEAVVMAGQIRQTQDVEDLIGEGWDNRGLGQVFNGALRTGAS